MAIDVAAILERLIARENLDAETVERVFTTMMSGDMLPEQTAGLLVALRAKGETVSEVTGAARAMRAAATKIEAPRNAIDMCGTGGDGLHTVNISTAAALVVAAAGIPVAKHGNRSVSSKSGSADVLEVLGIPINLSPSDAATVLAAKGFAFLFAPNFHPAMKYAIGPRRALGIRTIFNLLGPLTNPASVKRQVIGVFSRHWVKPLAEALGQLGAERAMVVHSHDGMDELSLSAPTHVAELTNGKVETYDLDTTTFGLSASTLAAIRGGDAKANAESIMSAVAVGNNEVADWIALNAAAGLRVALDLDWSEAVEMARLTLREGKVVTLLERLRQA